MTPLTHINAEGHVAAVYGLEEAIFLDAILFWYRTNRANNLNFRDGRWWTYNSIKALETVFPWWSAKQVRRIAASCREQGALIVGEFNQDRRDRSLWYTPSDGLLALYGLKSETGTCTCPDGQMQSPERADSVAQMGECNIRKPCSNHGGTDIPPYSPPEGDKSAPAHEPEAFEAFWVKYPRKDGRKAAIRAWDKLKPDKALCRTMYAALSRQRGSAQWAEEGGRFIPHFSTWLNGRKWEDQGVDLSLLAAPSGAPGGWAEDPEVSP